MHENPIGPASQLGGGGAVAIRRFGATTRKVLRKPQFWFGALAIVPTIAYYWIYAFGPILSAFPIALQDYRLLDPSKSPFIGLANFRSLFGDPLLLTATKNTLLWAVYTFCLALPIALLVSVCLVSIKRGRNLYQGLIYLPVVVSLVAVILLFRMLMDPEVGQFNQILRQLHLPEPRWLSSSDTALITSVAIGTWKGLGFNVILLTAGMLGIPQEIYDAAVVDGVNAWSRFRHITMPLLAHTLLLITVLMAIGTLQEFTMPYILTNGGPGTATTTYNMLLYKEAFSNMRFGVASAAALLQFAVIVTISIAQLKLLRPRWSY